MNQKHFSKKSVFSKVLLVILISLIAFAVYAFIAANAKSDWDTEFPLANAHVSWQQTFYGIPEVDT